jgi:hypothetical protein
MEAREFLREALGRGPAPLDGLKRRAALEGVSERALGRAREALGVRSFARDGARYWALPYVRKADRPKPQPEQLSMMVDYEEAR